MLRGTEFINFRPARSARYFAVAAILFTLGNVPATNSAELPAAALICEQRNELPWVDVAEVALANDARIRLVSTASISARCSRNGSCRR